MSKEIQMTLSFCGALAAMILISAPVNETTALAGSGVAFFISGGFFYGGIGKYFADKEKQTQDAEQKAELTLKNFAENFIRAQNELGEQNLELVAEMKNQSEILNNAADTLKRLALDCAAVKDNSDELKKLSKSNRDILDFAENFIRAQNELGEQNLGLVAEMKNQSEILNNAADTLKRLALDCAAVKDNSDELKKLSKSNRDILDEMEDLAENVEKVSAIKETLQDLMTTINRQEEFYKATLNQYRDITGKDVALIELLSRKL